jgi:ferredoxin
VNSLLECWKTKPAVTLSPALPSDLKPLEATQSEATGYSRRSFFSAFRSGSSSLAVQAIPEILAVALGRRNENPHARPNLADHPKFVPERHRSLFNSLLQLKETPSPAAFDSDVWGDVTVESTCNGCGACVEICPSGALMTIQQEGLWGLFFEGSRCTQCGVCANICCRESIRLNSVVPLDKLIAQQPRVLIVKPEEAIENLMEPMEERIARYFDCQVTG